MTAYYTEDSPMWQAFEMPPSDLDLMAGVTLGDIERFVGTKRIAFSNGVAKYRSKTYAHFDLRGNFADADGCLREHVWAKSIEVEVAKRLIPPAAWGFGLAIPAEHARERMSEYHACKDAPWCAVVPLVVARLASAMEWDRYGYERSYREKIWLTVARATAVAAGKTRKQFARAIHSTPLDQAVGALYGGADWIDCAKKWIKEEHS